MEIYAHRGSSLTHPENTLAAFTAALDEGCTGIETDIRVTRDDRLVLVHDGDLQRVADDPRRIVELTLTELRRVRLPVDQRVPTLEELWELAATKARLNLELKDPRAVPRLIPFLQEHPGDVLLTSEHAGALATVKRALPLVATGLVLDLWERSTLERLRGDGHRVASLCVDHFRPEIAARCADVGIQVLLWVVNRPDLAREVVRQGAAGVFTDCPGLLIRGLEDCDRWRGRG